MAIALDTNAQQTSNNSTLSFTMGSVSNGILFVCVIGDATDTLSGITYNGVAMSFLNKTSFDRWIYMYYMVSPPSGAHNIVVSGLSFCLISGVSYSGAKQTGVPDSTATPSGSGTSSALTTTVVASNCWLIALNYGGGGTNTVGAGTTSRGDVNANPTVVDSNGTVGTGAQTLTVNFTSGSWIGIATSFAPFVAVTTNSGFLTFI